MRGIIQKQSYEKFKVFHLVSVVVSYWLYISENWPRGVGVVLSSIFSLQEAETGACL